MQPKILILGTGGTIAGMASDVRCPGAYQAAQLSVQALVAAIPDLEKAAGGKLGVQQVAQIDSKDMDDGVWRTLLQACDNALNDDTVAGIVITHGTDTLEETAWFLQQCLGHLPKPVVLTCAMRPANALTPDGPQNLKDAVIAAAARGAAGKPLLRGVAALTGGGELHSARWVQKVHPHRLLAFSSGEQGPLGWVVNGRLMLRGGDGLGDSAHAWPHAYTGTHALATLPAAGVAWPWVEIITSHAGARAGLVQALVAQGVQALVVATTGNGTVHQALVPALAQARSQGIPVWCASRCGEGTISGARLPAKGDLLADVAVALSPAKARVALQLALMGWAS